jgi:hypothetical protein
VSGTTTRIRVSKHNIAVNRVRSPAEWGTVLTVFTPADGIQSGYGAEIAGPSRVVYDGKDVWIETESTVHVKEEPC